MNLARVAEVAAAECERQRVGVHALARLLTAYAEAEAWSIRHEVPHLDDLFDLGRLIEPVYAAQWRTTPVTFRGGGSSAHHSVIPGAMWRWVVRLPFRADIEKDPTIVDEVIKAFLDIHPFADGNGRSAWILRTWLLDQWEEPEPLPIYFP